MRGLRAVALALVLLLAAVVTVQAVRPAWYLRVVLPLEYEQYITTHADNYGLDPALLASVINVESSFDPDAESQAGAIGLMQLTPDTGQGIADRTGGSRWTVEDLHDPELNIRYGAWYLAHLETVFADQPDPEMASLAAYNAGQGNVREWAEGTGGLAMRDIPFEETRAYVERVLDGERDYRQAYAQLASG